MKSTMLFSLSYRLATCSSAYGFPALAQQSGSDDAEGPIAELIGETWRNPSDTLSILLLIGGDVVLKALAQLSGRRVVPVAFSFGWVAYSFNTLMSVCGDGRLMPKPDYPAKLINAKSGFVRENRSWVLGRLLRDSERPLPGDVGLCITVYQASVTARHGVPDLDWCWWGGVVIIILQLAFSAIPFALYGDWSIFTVTSAGTVLALITGALPQWRDEKWACRKNPKKLFCLTGGNGTRSAMVILSNGNGLDLEDLAGAESPMVPRRGQNQPPTAFGLPITFLLTQVASLILAVLWIVILITVTGIDEHAWYLLLVGGLGMLQNAIVAGARRGIGTSGIHLEVVEEFSRRKVMHAIMDLEQAYPSTGRPLLSEFFPNESKLREDEVKWWSGDRTEYDEKRKETEAYRDCILKEETVSPETDPKQARRNHQATLGKGR
ncbi:hypothetical protein VNI00_002354 [Paramarasmius palmivorus]|uniref:Uncharacterized protein n=1 Tax=Paramarasmius palmivorus TaxID=297713 RepID=A0AAW0DYI3_9AGAR